MTPAVNQVELHPRFQQPGLRREHEDLGIVTEAWSPLAQGDVLDDPVIAGSPRTTTGPPARWCIRWHLQLGNVVFPKSVTPERIEENFDVFGFHLSEARWTRSRRSTPASGAGPTRTRSSGPSALERHAVQPGRAGEPPERPVSALSQRDRITHSRLAVEGDQPQQARRAVRLESARPTMRSPRSSGST